MSQCGKVASNPANAAATESRRSKRRKMSHGPPQHQSRPEAATRPRSQATGRRNKAKSRRLLPQPPRKIRPEYAAGPVSSTQSQTRTTLKDYKETTTLSFAKSLLDKIWMRNKNQHRTQPWWRSLSTLRKAITRLDALEDEERLLQSQAQGSGSEISAQDVRKRFEREAQLRGEKEIWTEWIREVLLPKAYLGFSGLVGDTQFANLGVVLVGILADIVSIVGTPSKGLKDDEGQEGTKITETRGGQEMTATGKARSLMATSLRVTGLQSGVLVEREYDSDDLGEVIERRGSSERSSKQKQIPIDEEDGILPATSTSKLTNEKVPAVPEQQPRTARPAPADRAATAHSPSTPDLALDEVKTKKQDRVNRPEKAHETKPKLSKSKGKKGKGKTAIDDLFAGLT